MTDTIKQKEIKKGLLVASENPLDIDLLKGYLDNLGREVVQQMLDLYTQQSTLYLSDIQSTLETQDESEWRDKCHKMKGAGRQCGPNECSWATG